MYLTDFYVICLLLYPLKTSENQGFYDLFRGYRKRSVAWKNGLMGNCFVGRGGGLSGCGNLRKYNFDHRNLFQT